jgi:RNA polymerase sigma-70 factor (ECF subfamily)
LRYALARTRSRALAEDVAQEALAALVQRWRRYGPPDAPEAFVFTIAARRASRALIRRAILVPLEAAALRASAVADPAAAIEQSLELERVFTALGSLGRRDREALLLSAVGGLNAGEVAVVTRSSVASVKMRLSRARKRLRATLDRGARDA